MKQQNRKNLLWASVVIAAMAPTLTRARPSVHSRALQTNSTPAAPQEPTTLHRTALYFPNWSIYGRNYQPQDLPADKLTHVLYAFANVRPDTGEVYLSDTYADLDKHYPTDAWNDNGTNVYGCVKQLYLLKKQHRQMKVLLSIGGWSYSNSFPAPAATESGRQTFANSAVQLVKDLGFDGLDVDWEYPSTSGEGENLVQLLTTTRVALQNYSSSVEGNPKLLLTAAVSAGPEKFKNLKIAEMDPLLDFYNLMAYDYAGSWDNVTGHSSNLYPSTKDPECTPFSTDAAVKFYLEQGATPSKMLLGMPTYGHAFLNTEGPGKPFNGVGEGSWEAGIWDDKVLPQTGAKVFFDDETKASWSYDSSTQTMVSFDNLEAAQAKLTYIGDQKLGGAMWWEASGDHPVNNSESLVATVVQGLGDLDSSQNVLDFPQSKYDNLRAGMPGE